MIIQPINFKTADEKNYREIVGAIKEECSQIDGLVNNAGILGEKKPLEQYSYSVWEMYLKSTSMQAFY